MKKHILPLVIAAAALLLGGCLPEEFIWWSPDGQTAAVRTSDGLRLTGTNGQLSAVILPGEIQSASWLPDGSGLIVSRSFKLTNWAAAEKMIPRGEAAATMQMARAIPDLLKAGLTASGGSWDNLEEKFLKPLGMTESQVLEPALSCALSLHREQIVAAIASFTNAAALEAELYSAETNGISVYEISILSMRNDRPAGEPRALIRSLRPLLDPVLSQRHSILAFRTGEGALKAMTLDGKSSLVVAGENVPSVVWSADGRALIHVVMGKSDQVGEIRSRTVVSGSGELLPGAPQAETLAMAAFVASASPRLRVLPDGRILFASVPITLPARTASIHPGAQFFLLDPAKPDMAPVAVAIKEGSLPDDLSAFAASPDGRFVAVVEGGTDVVAVLELATGKVKIVSPSHADGKSRMIPAWRNHRELTFAALPTATAARPELILWQADAPERTLSKDWPDNVVRPWLEAPRTGGDQPAK
ncbi:MAG: hypothetical protein AAB676_18795 [Verrucomicrobiota bacterium]